jgi:hypothetical protein
MRYIQVQLIDDDNLLLTNPIESTTYSYDETQFETAQYDYDTILDILAEEMTDEDLLEDIEFDSLSLDVCGDPNCSCSDL